MTDERAQAYAKRFNRVFDYIDHHLDEDLSLDLLSQVANFSKFHFQRQFTDYCGISVSRYIQLVRMKRASYRLAFNPLERIIDIALEAGFENPESFSRAFKHLFGQTPSQFRANPAWEDWCQRYHQHRRKRKLNREVTIVDYPTTALAVLEHVGSPHQINHSVRRFIEWRAQTGLAQGDGSLALGIAYDNPETTPAQTFRFGIARSVEAPVPPNHHGVVNKTLPGGRCAVLRHTGAHEGLCEQVPYLYRDWLPQSGEELRDFPLFFHYLNFVPETPEHLLVTDIYLPLK
ncbi:MAG: GyrI-like domain-containing protein [Paludibacterium sp.]|uniref:AraC family transcriptional regulator n=1 Tax=Paludibacterium sp. TaxID=1917523 RepID=UPI0025D27FA2|nr:GyrI-like domain-containing protein [Paludibacterium sp.]MBV8049516.1 GyrI-like domain-containing protein [Paludibacterium sp.]MBV8646223.1 GyrI-like domain-containing protein [Paludibacterium sp.]